MANLPVPAERTWNTGDIVTAALLNSNLRDAVNFLLNPPLFVGYQAASQDILTTANTPLAIDTNVVDTYNGHSTTSNNSRYYAQVAGWYSVIASVEFDGNATGSREIFLVASSGSLLYTASQVYNAGSAGNVNLNTGTWPVFLNVGDWIAADVVQFSGSTINTIAGASGLAVTWLHS